MSAGRDEGGFVHVGENAAESLADIHRRYENPPTPLEDMPYHEYLQTEWWRDLRRRKVRAAGFRCERCQTSGRRLDVHHLNYDRVGRERWEDLIVLCSQCHEREHGIGGRA